MTDAPSTAPEIPPVPEQPTLAPSAKPVSETAIAEGQRREIDQKLAGVDEKVRAQTPVPGVEEATTSSSTTGQVTGQEGKTSEKASGVMGFLAGLAEGAVKAKNAVWDFFKRMGDSMGDGLKKLFGIKEKAGEEVAKAGEAALEKVKKILDLLDPDAPVFSFPAGVGAVLTSPYGNRMHPIYHEIKFHHGVDIGVPEGTPIAATVAGTVIKSEFDKGSGNFVILRLPSGKTAKFSHLKEPGVPVGTEIARGDVLGFVGSTGVSTGPHLHFSIFDSGKSENPEEFLASRFRPYQEPGGLEAHPTAA